MREFIIFLSLILFRVFFLRSTAETTDKRTPQVEPDPEEAAPPLPTHQPPVTPVEHITSRMYPRIRATEQSLQRLSLAQQPVSTRQAAQGSPMQGHPLSRILRRRSGLKQGVLWMTVLPPPKPSLIAMPTSLLLALSMWLLLVGILVFFTKAHLIFLLIGVELMLSAVHLNLMVFNQHHIYRGLTGQVGVLLSLVVMACELAIALALVVRVYQHYRTIDIHKIRKVALYEDPEYV